MSTVRIFEALPSQQRGREIARTENLGDATSIASNMGKVYTEFVYTVEIESIDTAPQQGRILTYKAGEQQSDHFTGTCTVCDDRIQRDATTREQSAWLHTATGSAAGYIFNPHYAAPTEG